MKTTTTIKLGITLLFIGLFSFNSSFSQTTSILQFVVKNVREPGNISTLDSLMNAQPGMIVTRTDFWTRNFVGLVNDPTNFDELSLRPLLFTIGLGLDCHSLEPYNGETITPINARICQRNDY